MQSTDLSWDLPYASQRDPVFARNVVATSQPLATAAGIQALRDGGNAIDAALATAITLTVVEPGSNGVGSDAFAIVWFENQLYGLNASGRSPRLWNPEHFRKYSAMPRLGWDAVTVPGAVSAWAELSSKFGRLPFERLFDSAIHYAQNGFLVGRRTAALWKAFQPSLGQFEGFRKHFLPNGRAPETGELAIRRELAQTLKLIAESNGESFYRGELARRIAEQSSQDEGLLRYEDLAEHRAEWCDPLSIDYSGITAHEIPPNGQGLATLIALGLLDRLNTRSLEPDSPDWTHLQVEAMKVAVRAAIDHFADLRAMRIDPKELLASSALDRAAETISMEVANQTPCKLPTSSDTVFLCSADEDGNMVSFIQSNFQGFGSGIVIDGTGIAMQNRGAGFTLESGHPNQVDSNKRPFHTIIPGFVTRGNRPELAYGVMGGHMQHQGHVQMITRIFDHGQNPQAATDAPRWHVTPEFDVVLEKGFSESTQNELLRRGHSVRMHEGAGLFGGAQLIARLEDGYCAASDHRKEGLAAGY